MLLVVLICFDDHGSSIGWCGMHCPMRHVQGFPWCLWMPLQGECLGHIARVAAMVINVTWGPMAYKTKILAYHLWGKPIVDFCDGKKKSASDSIDKVWRPYGMMLRFSNTKSSMLFKILSVGKAPRVELDKLLDKTTVQGLSMSQGLSPLNTHW